MAKTASIGFRETRELFNIRKEMACNTILNTLGSHWEQGHQRVRIASTPAGNADLLGGTLSFNPIAAGRAQEISVRDPVILTTGKSRI